MNPPQPDTAPLPSAHDTAASQTHAVPVARRWRDRLLLQEDLNFLLTNRIPRIAASWLLGRYSRLRSPLLARLSIAVWRWFTDLDLSDARQQRFDSLHDCFTRELKPGARTVDPRPGVLASPCDAIVGAMGRVGEAGQADQVFQAKGFAYRTADLFGSAEAAAPFEGGCYFTLRLTSAMYHRFHAPADAHITHVRHIAGDTWNVNPIALKRVQRLFCRNERAVLHLRLQDDTPERGHDGTALALVPVAAIGVASLRLHAPALHLHTAYRGADEIACDVAVKRGQELGWFEHGSTIIVFTPPGFDPAPGIATGVRIRMGQALLWRRAADSTAPDGRSR